VKYPGPFVAIFRWTDAPLFRTALEWVNRFGGPLPGKTLATDNSVRGKPPTDRTDTAEQDVVLRRGYGRGMDEAALLEAARGGDDRAFAAPLSEVAWLTPYPDSWLSPYPDPQADAERRETVALAFVAALRHLSRPSVPPCWVAPDRRVRPWRSGSPG
jgi:hypothetical protein